MENTTASHWRGPRGVWRHGGRYTRRCLVWIHYLRRICGDNVVNFNVAFKYVKALWLFLRIDQDSVKGRVIGQDLIDL